jgi:hypothetical protein
MEPPVCDLCSSETSDGRPLSWWRRPAYVCDACLTALGDEVAAEVRARGARRMTRRDEWTRPQRLGSGCVPPVPPERKDA